MSLEPVSARHVNGDSHAHNGVVRTSKLASSALARLDALIALDADPRPTFVVDTTSFSNSQHFQFAYINPALNTSKDLCASLEHARQHSSDFGVWLCSTAHKKHYRFAGAIWFSFLVENRWNVVSTTLPGLTKDLDVQSSIPNAVQCLPGCADPTSLQLSNQDLITCQATINQLEGELRLLAFDKRLANKERDSCIETVRRLKEQLRATHGAPIRTNILRTASHDSASRPIPPVQAPSHSQHSKLASSPAMVPAGPKNNDAHEVQSLPTTIASCSNPFKHSRPLSGDSSDATFALQKFQRLAEMVDVGFFDYDPNGKLLHANDAWYALSGHPRELEAHVNFSFMSLVYPDDIELVTEKWATLLKGQAVTFEMRWKKSSTQRSDSAQPFEAQWVVAACVPVIDENGIVTSISGCTSNINAQKHTATAALQKAEALERARASEERFTRFATVAPIAIFRFDKHKNMEYCNDRWFEMTGISKSRFDDIRYPFGVYDDDVKHCTRAWETAIERRSIGTIEFRLRKEWHDVHGRRGPTWVYCSFFPEFGEDGQFVGLMGSLSDISHLKWAENMQKSRAEEALEAKRQQENFIDITSHEMRNPLSAMVQCADSIMSTFHDLSHAAAESAHVRSEVETAKLREQIETGMDAAQTILSCAAHQKRIVDDILTLSKLDSNLLLITPVKTQPVEMVRNLIRIFEVDSRKADIVLAAEICPSITTLQASWLVLDPSRVLQILINLVTNAIKFTRDEATRSVTVKVSVSLQPPSRQDSSLDYIPAEIVTDDYGKGEDWGEGEALYLKFEVQDTGRGLDEEEKAKLFLRFSQCSPKTHVQYGGSGLGLFISRRLTEMQGGEIGFASEPRVGSRFAFYVKTRRTAPPLQAEEWRSTPTATSPCRAPVPVPIKDQKLNILLVEDNIVNQRVLSGQLKKTGCSVTVAGHGVEALEYLKTTQLWADETSQPLTPPMDPADPLKRNPLDMILMDIEMPVMGGLECTRIIRKHQEDGLILKHIPIISISANARQEQQDEARLAGVDDTITKPFRISELMPKLQKLSSMALQAQNS